MNTRIRVLLVDDDRAFTRALKLNLEDGGRYEITVINHPGSAVEVARRNPPDVVLLDVMMPALDGATVANAMRETPELSRTPVIFLTALVQKSEEKGLREHSPVRRYVGKPVTAEELDAAIREVLEVPPDA